ncbi:hypothetical protein GCM10010211_29770 [Streptomyces albospinus]|uniref:Uncharacterized protein n=1 Tax=Streptomyces albospinus TaxID=285515 RepID=A0ABQ2V2G3_9ACTN|nr:hypothetical protein [Streptomyces albospinus]GGU62912.1 hypothetical protein GCM10010211_29770 [Streptomyces albospinus]
MTTTVDAERAWQDLQRIRVPQERVYDEIERSAHSDPKVTYVMAAVMWVFLATMGLKLPGWCLWLTLAAYVGTLGSLAAVYSRRARMRLHRSRYSWRSYATFIAGMAVTGGTILLSDNLADAFALPYPSLITATAAAAAFVLFTGPANRWAVSPLRERALRGHATQAIHEEAGL